MNVQHDGTDACSSLFSRYTGGLVPVLSNGHKGPAYVLSPAGSGYATILLQDRQTRNNNDVCPICCIASARGTRYDIIMSVLLRPYGDIVVGISLDKDRHATAALPANSGSDALSQCVTFADSTFPSASLSDGYRRNPDHRSYSYPQIPGIVRKITLWKKP